MHMTSSRLFLATLLTSIGCSSSPATTTSSTGGSGGAGGVTNSSSGSGGSGGGGSGGAKTDADCVLHAFDTCNGCCDQVHAKGLTAYTGAIADCFCGGPCAAACAETICKDPNAEPGDVCQACKGNNLPACASAVAAACTAEPDCSARQACRSGCPPQGLQEADVACTKAPHAECLSCCDGNHPAGAGAVDCLCKADVCAAVCGDTLCAQKPLVPDSPCQTCVDAGLGATGACASTGQSCYNVIGQDCVPLMTCWYYCQ